MKKYIKKIKSNMCKKKIKNFEIIFIVLISILSGILIGQNFINNISTGTQIKIKDENFKKFIVNYEYIINNYYKELDGEDLVDSAIEGMMDSLDDPYSTVIDENESNTFSITLEGSYEGIGLQIAKKENGSIYVVSILKNSPASKSDIKVGDEIISINEKKTKNMEITDFSEFVTDNEIKEFKLVVLRDGDEKNIIINKSHIEISSVSSEIIEKNNKIIGYIYIGIFASNTYEQFKTELETLENEEIDALIIDVRSNSGGHLTSVDKILDLFLNKKQIMYQFQTNKQIEKIYGTGTEKKKQYDIVLLGDNNSASASEVLIAGLKDNFNYILIGEKTFGKGSVQEILPISNKVKYKITTKTWLTPKSKNLNDGGIKPDIELKLNEKYYETYLQEDDNQLNRAIQYIIEKK